MGGHEGERCLRWLRGASSQRPGLLLWWGCTRGTLTAARAACCRTPAPLKWAAGTPAGGVLLPPPTYRLRCAVKPPLPSPSTLPPSQWEAYGHGLAELAEAAVDAASGIAGASCGLGAAACLAQPLAPALPPLSLTRPARCSLRPTRPAARRPAVLSNREIEAVVNAVGSVPVRSPSSCCHGLTLRLCVTHVHSGPQGWLRGGPGPAALRLRAARPALALAARHPRLVPHRPSPACSPCCASTPPTTPRWWRRRRAGGTCRCACAWPGARWRRGGGRAPARGVGRAGTPPAALPAGSEANRRAGCSVMHACRPSATRMHPSSHFLSSIPLG